MTMTTPDFFDRHPEVAQRLANRISSFVSVRPDGLDLELAEMLTAVDIEPNGIVVSVQFRDQDTILAECCFDGAALGLHAVDSELVVIEP